MQVATYVTLLMDESLCYATISFPARMECPAFFVSFRFIVLDVRLFFK